MTPYKIARAIALTRRFTEAAAHVLDEAAMGGDKSNAPIPGSTKSAALRRASMELTRALAEMRRPS